MKIKKIKLGRYFFDFVSVFFAVIAAFALNNWNDNRRDTLAEEKILMEIRNGLRSDLIDLKVNRQGHMDGLYACALFEQVFKGNTIPQDSIYKHYVALTDGALSAMNTSGYESLKSRGLELIKNDSIRIKIIELYDFDYQNLRKFEEEHPSTQYFENYYLSTNDLLSKYLNYDETGNIESIDVPIKFTEKEKKLMLSYIWQMRGSRSGMFHLYEETELKINALLESINNELANR